MELIPLTAISPIDGRYRKHVQHLDEYFSEYALIKYRVLVEIEYFFFLEDKKFFKLSHKASKHLKKLQEDSDAVICLGDSAYHRSSVKGEMGIARPVPQRKDGVQQKARIL